MDEIENLDDDLSIAAESACNDANSDVERKVAAIALACRDLYHFALDCSIAKMYSDAQLWANIRDANDQLPVWRKCFLCLRELDANTEIQIAARALCVDLLTELSIVQYALESSLINAENLLEIVEANQVRTILLNSLDKLWNENGNSLTRLALRTRAFLTVHFDAPEMKPRKAPAEPMTRSEASIWAKLNGAAYTKEELAFAAECSESTVAIACRKWIADGKVINKPGLGYYRPDAPPIGPKSD